MPGYPGEFREGDLAGDDPQGKVTEGKGVAARAEARFSGPGVQAGPGT
jgi:hypothetical protein